jgi:hypothetical protein
MLVAQKGRELRAWFYILNKNTKDLVLGGVMFLIVKKVQNGGLVQNVGIVHVVDIKLSMERL